MSDTRRQRGRQSEFILARWFQRNGFPHAEATPKFGAGSDVTGLVGLDAEMKATQNFQPALALRQQKKRLTPGVLGFMVWRPASHGEEKVSDWIVAVRLSDFTDLLRLAGYGDKPDRIGDPLDETIPTETTDPALTPSGTSGFTLLEPEPGGWNFAIPLDGFRGTLTISTNPGGLDETGPM